VGNIGNMILNIPLVLVRSNFWYSCIYYELKTFFLSEKTVGEFPTVDFITNREMLYTVHTYIGG
jgi:hypothetical protein